MASSDQRSEIRGQEKSRSLDYATRRAKLRRERENRVAPLGVTKRESGKERRAGISICGKEVLQL